MSDAAGPALRAWVAEVAGAPLRAFERAAARREAWIARVDDGGARGERRLFVRLARPGDPANGGEALHHEARVVRALRGGPVPVPAVLGESEALGAVAYEHVEGLSELEREAPERQQAVYRHYLECLAALHRLDVDALALPSLARPASPRQAALAPVDALLASLGHLVREPLAAFGVAWLRRHAPESVDRIALLHGDAGTPNFLYQGERVRALIDWEWAHVGDPMEDLGNACIHASFHPSGEFRELLRHYEAVSGLPVDLARVRYYRVHLMVRSVLALAASTARWDPHVPVALNLCFRVVSDRICCDAIADAMGLPRERPELPFVPERDPTLYHVVAANLRVDVLPELASAFARSRLEGAALLVEALEREQRIGPALAELECDELGALLGRRPADLATGLQELERAIGRAGAEREPELLRYLGRRAWRTEQLLRPVASLHPDRELRPID